MSFFPVILYLENQYRLLIPLRGSSSRQGACSWVYTAMSCVFFCFWHESFVAETFTFIHGFGVWFQLLDYSVTPEKLRLPAGGQSTRHAWYELCEGEISNARTGLMMPPEPCRKGVRRSSRKAIHNIYSRYLSPSQQFQPRDFLQPRKKPLVRICNNGRHGVNSKQAIDKSQLLRLLKQHLWRRSVFPHL